MLQVPASTRRAVAAAMAATGIALFGWLLESIAGNWGLADLDWPLLRLLADHREAAATALFQFLHGVSGPRETLAAAAGAAVVWAVLRRELRRPALLLGALLADLLLVVGARYWVGRERPPAWFEAAAGGDGPAFPSAHTSAVLTLLAVALYLGYARRARHRGLLAGVAAVVVLAGAVAASDLYLGRHWFTDTLAALTIAAVVIAGVVWLDSLPHPAPVPGVAAEVAARRASAET